MGRKRGAHNAVRRPERLTISLSAETRGVLEAAAEAWGQSLSRVASDTVESAAPMISAVLEATARLRAAEDAYRRGGAEAVLQAAREFRGALLEAEERAYVAAEASVAVGDVETVMRSRLRAVRDVGR